MNMQELKELASLMQEYQLTKVALSADGEVPKERKPAAASLPLQAAEKQMPQQISVPEGEREPVEAPDGRVICAPMVGVFYTASMPDADPFVRPGDVVKPGDTLCIIEAMKLMNEVCAEQAGEIAEVLVQNGQLVEYGQPLFRLV